MTAPRPAGAARALAFVLAFAGLSAALIAQFPATVRVGTVGEESVRRHERVLGSLMARSRAVLSVLEEGPLLEVRVRPAGRVAKGDVIARTDTRRLEAQRAQRLAELEAARAAVPSREAELQRAREDFEALGAAAEKNAVSQTRLREARTAVAVAEAGLEAARKAAAAIEAGLELLDVRIADCTLVAPFDARVVTRMAEPGEWLNAGEPVAELVSAGEIEAWLEAPERLWAPARALGEPLEMQVQALDERVVSRTTAVRAEVDPRARTFTLIALLDDRDGALGPGMSVTAWMPVGEPEPRITLPSDAVVRRVGQTFVYRVVKGDQGEAVESVPVLVDFERGGRAVLAAGSRLAPGDRVVTEGNERLMPGSGIIVVGQHEDVKRGDVDPLERRR